MKNKKMKKLLTVALTSALMVNTISLVKATTAPNSQGKAVTADTSKLIPQPSHVEYADGDLTMTEHVNVKGQDVADADAVRALKAYLTANGITVNDSDQEADTTIILAEADDELQAVKDVQAALGMDNATALADEGYVLGIAADDNGGNIVIEGKDGDGTFYAVQTLKQLTTADGSSLRVKEAVIKDEPVMGTRGIVEGFYGTPWPHQDRLNQLDFYGKMKLNTYIYGPKDDPYHREKWREPYPAAEMVRMNELIQKAYENKVDFVFGISPGIDVVFDGEQAEVDFQALMTKCQSLYDMGVRSFAIFFDDINNTEGDKQAAFVNRFNDEFVKVKDNVKPLITVPTQYNTIAMTTGNEVNQYTKDFAATLEPDINVLWTGSAVVPEGIDVANAQLVNSIYGKRMGIWWNYPVTDYIKEKLGLGPVYNLDKGLMNEVDIFTMNPMEHAELSEITLATGADYSWNTPAYDYNVSFDNAIQNLYGDLASEMKTFANHSTRLVAGWASTGRADAPEVKEQMNAFIKNIAQKQDASAEIAYLNAEFDAMINAADILTTSFTSDQLKHCSGNLNKLKALGENDKLALELFVAKDAGDEAEVTRLSNILKGKLSSLNAGNKVSEGTALAFIKDALNYDPEPKADFETSSTFVEPGEAVTLKNNSSVSSIDFEWSCKGADKETSTAKDYVVKFAKEGVYTVSLIAKNSLGENEVVKENIITVSKEAKNDRVNLSIGATATASHQTAASESADKAIDGIVTTKWCATQKRPHTLTIDMKDIKTLTGINIYHAEAGGEGAALNSSDYRILISTDGTNYTEMLKVTNNTKGITNDPLKVSLARYVRLIVDTPTQGGDSAARIYEVEIMGLNKTIEIPPVYKEDTSLMKGILANTIAKVEKAIEEGQLEKLAPAVVTMIQTRLADAKAVHDNEDATNAQLADAWMNLAEAMHYLDFKADKALLKVLIEECSKLDMKDYKEGVEDFLKALSNANTVYNNANALQASIDKAYKDLETARDGLVKKDVVNTALLEKLVQQIENTIGDGSKYIKNENWNIFQDALQHAKDMLLKEDVTQAEINAAMSALTDAYENIRLTPDEALLENLRSFIKMMSALDANEYQANDYARMMEAKAKAEALLKDFNETTYKAFEKEMAAMLEMAANKKVETPDGNQSGVNKPSINNPAAKPNSIHKTSQNGVDTSDSSNVAGLLALMLLNGAGLYLINRRHKEEA